MTSPRGIRNRNPGNIVVSGWTVRQAGYLGPEPEGRFARFDTMPNGVAALIRLLQTYRSQHGLTTVRGIINRWAPPTENDTSAYVLAVAKALGTTPDTELPDAPLTYEGLARAIAAHENGRDAALAAITNRDYAEALASVFGTEEVVAAPAPEEPGILEKVKTTMSPLIIPAITALVEAVPSLLRIFKGDSKTVERNAKAVEVISSVVKEVTGASSVAAAAEVVLTDPAVKAQFEQAIQGRYYDLVEVGGGIPEARVWAAKMSQGNDWRAIGFGALMAILSLIILVGGGFIFYQLLFHDSTNAEQRGMLVGALVAFLSAVIGYWFGSSVGSKQSGDAVRRIAEK